MWMGPLGMALTCESLDSQGWEPKDFLELQPRQNFGVQWVIEGCLWPLRDTALGASKATRAAVAPHNLFVARWNPKTLPDVYDPIGQVVLAQSPRTGNRYGPSHRLERNWGNPLKRNYHFPARWLGCPQGTTTDYIARGPGVEGQIHEIHPTIVTLYFQLGRVVSNGSHLKSILLV